ncbi:MAG: DUF6056 family protein [Lachnospiraceae bacterium]|nr:DUF6056 family protein [Lachnospiraceae bacterium]
MKDKYNGEEKKRVLWIASICLIILFFASLIPVFLISCYAHPLFDDYSYSAGVRNVVLSKGSVFDIVKASFDMVISTYRAWQGNYSATFFATLQPGVYKIPVYWLTTVIILGSLIVSGYLFSYVVICDFFKSKIEYALIIATIILGFQIQFVPYIQESFYWYNGGMAYSFFYSLFIIELTGLIKIFSSKNKSVILTICLSVLTFIIMGGNYSTMLICEMTLILFLVLSLLNKNHRVTYLILLLVGTLGFLTSILAPGNRVRASNNTSLNPINAIISSIKYSGKNIVLWTEINVIGLIILLSILFYYVIAETDFKFRYPAVFIVLAIGFFSAQATPPFYAMSSGGAQRQINIYYYSYYLLIAAILFYIEGWIIKRFGHIIKLSKVQTKVLRIVLIGISSIAICIGTYSYGIKNTTSGTTFLDLKSGRAQRYDAEYKRIERILEESEGDVYISDIEEYPNTFYRLGLAREDEVGFWINGDMAKYFGLNNIFLEQ